MLRPSPPPPTYHSVSRGGARIFWVREMRIGQAEGMMPEVVVYLLEGRTLDAKRSLVKDITDAIVKNLGAPPEAVTVSLIETPKTDKSKGGVLFSDMPARS